MPYLGRELTSGNYLKLDSIQSQFNGSLKTFNLKSGGQDFYPGSSYSLLVSLAGVIQEAESGYEINNNQITFQAAPANTDDCFIIVMGLALGIGVPGDGTVGSTQLQDNSVGSDELQDNSVGSSEIQSGAVGLDELNETAKLNVSKNNVLVGSAVTGLNFRGTGISTTQYTAGIATVYVDQGASLGVTTSIGLGAGTTISTGNLQTINFAGPGVSTGYYNAGVGIATIFFEGGGGSVGAAGTWVSDAVGVATSKVVGVGTAKAVGAANSEGALQALGNIAITDGMLLTDSDISSNIFVPPGKNALLIGTVNVAVGATIDVANGSTLVVV